MPRRPVPHLRESDVGRLRSARGSGSRGGARIAVVSRSPEGTTQAHVASAADLAAAAPPGSAKELPDGPCRVQQWLVGPTAKTSDGAILAFRPNQPGTPTPN